MLWTAATMPDPKSVLLILSRNTMLKAQAKQLLAPLGWHLQVVSQVPSALDLLAKDNIAAVLIDNADYDLAALTAGVRALPAPANGTPILTIDAAAAPLDDAAFAELIEGRVGPLGDHALRAAPFDTRYRLVRLVGWDNASAMVERFRGALAEAIATAQRDPATVPAHRLAGLAGMIGYGELHRLWSRVDAGEPDALAAAVEASRQALAD